MCPLSLVTVADIVDKHFVPGLTEWLKKIELQSFNKFVIQIRLGIIQKLYIFPKFFLNHEVGHGKEAESKCDVARVP
jgi:hypothetical protein